MTKPALSAKQQRFIDEMVRVRGIEFARIGMQVEIDGSVGTIVGANASANLQVTFANQAKHGSKPRNCHPTWRAKYFDENGELIAEFNDDGCVFRPDRPEQVPA